MGNKTTAKSNNSPCKTEAASQGVISYDKWNELAIYRHADN